MLLTSPDDADSKSIMIVTPTSNFSEAVAQEVLECPNWTRTVASSGAEYSYFGVGPLKSQSSVKVELISPASESVIARYAAAPRKIVLETCDEYAAKPIKPLADWIKNIINGTHEQDRTLLKSDEFILQADSKWTSFPSAENGSVYMQAIALADDLHSIRDLNSKHIPMLKEMKRAGLEVLNTKYNVDPETVRVFFHYPPQFYRLHAHFCLLSNPIADAGVERAHLIDDVIYLLNKDSDHFKNATLSIVLGK